MRNLILYIILIIFIVNQTLNAQNIRVLHYNIFTIDKNTELKDKKNNVVKNIISNINADIYSFSENPSKKNMIDKSTVFSEINLSQYKEMSYNTTDFYHLFLYNSFKMNVLSVKNIFTKSNPILHYKLNYLVPDYENRIINCFIIRSENAGNQLIEYINEISKFIIDNRLDGYNLIMGSTDNIQIQDKIILENSELIYQDSLNILELSKNFNYASDKIVSSIEPKFDMAYLVENVNNDKKKFQFIPESFTPLTKKINSFYIEIEDALIDSMLDISAHIPFYFELEPISAVEESAPKEKLSFNDLVINNLTLTLNWDKEELIYLHLLSIIGNSIYQTSFICPTSEYQIEIPMSSLAPGLYILKLKTSDGEIRKSIQKIEN